MYLDWTDIKYSFFSSNTQLIVSLSLERCQEDKKYSKRNRKHLPRPSMKWKPKTTGEPRKNTEKNRDKLKLQQGLGLRTIWGSSVQEPSQRTSHLLAAIALLWPRWSLPDTGYAGSSAKHTWVLQSLEPPQRLHKWLSSLHLANADSLCRAQKPVKKLIYGFWVGDGLRTIMG